MCVCLLIHTFTLTYNKYNYSHIQFSPSLESPTACILYESKENAKE